MVSIFMKSKNARGGRVVACAYCKIVWSATGLPVPRTLETRSARSRGCTAANVRILPAPMPRAATDSCRAYFVQRQPKAKRCFTAVRTQKQDDLAGKVACPDVAAS